MRIFVDLMQWDIQMMRDAEKAAKESGCSPKKKAVIWRFVQRGHRRNSDAENTFKKLVLLDLIEHKSNGHCWLTDKGAQALLSAQ